MNTIKNIKFDIKYLPIIITCKSYSKFLDSNVKQSRSGLKLDVSYLENIHLMDHLYPQIYDKKYIFLIKKSGDSVIEDGYTFFKLSELLICDTIERYYIFFKEECGTDETRDNILNKLI